MSNKNSPPNRGDYEQQFLTPQQRQERRDLPEGVGLELSPFWDFQENPYGLYKHMVRYFFIADELWSYVTANFPTPCTVKALDIGSGYGEMRVFMRGLVRPAGYKLTYTGCDIDPMRMSRARSLIPSIDIVPIEPLPDGLLKLAETGPYNTVICSEVYEHLEPSEGEKLLENMLAVTEPKTVAVFTIPTPSFSKYRKIPMHLNEVEPEVFIAAAESHGWRVLNWYYMRGRTSEKAKNIPTAMRSTLWLHSSAQKAITVYMFREEMNMQPTEISELRGKLADAGLPEASSSCG